MGTKYSESDDTILAAHGLCCHKMSLCLSVQLSATHRYSVETAKHIIQIFHLWV